MKESPGPDPTPASPAAHPGGTAESPDWGDALATLVSARLAIFQAESRQAARSSIRRIVAAIAAAIFLLLAWLLFVAGGVSAIAAVSGRPWYWIALAAGGIHLLVALILLANARKSGSPSFPVTRAEFQKDRQWIDQCRNKPTSTN